MSMFNLHGLRDQPELLLQLLRAWLLESGMGPWQQVEILAAMASFRAVDQQVGMQLVCQSAGLET
jgi:hypothetical protein